MSEQEQPAEGENTTEAPAEGAEVPAEGEAADEGAAEEGAAEESSEE